MGLVSRVVDDDALTQVAGSIAAELAGVAPRALSEIKRLVGHAYGPLTDGLELEIDAVMRQFEGDTFEDVVREFRAGSG